MADSPDPEVDERPRRRRFSAEYKQAILAEYDLCSADGAKGALLRREGLYSSHIVAWRRARDEGGREALGRVRGRKPADPRDAELERLRRRNERLEVELARSRLVIEVQGKSLGAVGAALRQRGAAEQVQRVTDAAVAELTAAQVPVTRACRAVGRPRASHYRRHPVTPRRAVYGPPTPRRPSPRALTPAERRRVLEVLHTDRFADAAPAQVWATLLDEGVYLASESTMYRLLRAEGEVRERRAQATHPARVKPELVADAPNQVWSWDITKLAGPAKWTAYHLYVVLDVYSRYAVGWTVAERETSRLAATLLADSVAKQRVDRDQLTIHADRGTSMASKPVAHLLALPSRAGRSPDQRKDPDPALLTRSRFFREAIQPATCGPAPLTPAPPPRTPRRPAALGHDLPDHPTTAPRAPINNEGSPDTS